eukprot:6482186-Amphidinium_carterae.1
MFMDGRLKIPGQDPIAAEIDPELLFDPPAEPELSALGVKTLEKAGVQHMCLNVPESLVKT